MSRRVTRPEIPVPVNRLMSIAVVFAIRRTTGDERVRRR